MRAVGRIAFILLLCGGVAGARATGAENARALAEAKAEAAEAARRSEALERQARQATSEAERARAEAEALAARIQASEADLTAAERRIAIIATLQSAHRARLAERQQPLVRLTGALQVMARRPAALALVQPGSIENIVQARSLLAATVPEIRRRTAAVRADVERSETLRRQAQQARTALLASRSDLQRRRAELAAFEDRQRSQSRALTGLALSESDRALVLGEEARSLARLIGTREFQSRLANRLGSLPPPLPRPGESNGSHSRTLPYRFPVEGRVLTGVGEISEGGVHSRGIRMATAPNAQVLAPAPGRILHAAPFRSYGYVLIIDHGAGWLTVLTDLATSRVAAGQVVSRGQLLGLAGGTDPQITVELRRNGRPVPFAQFVAA
jgi:murein hydrolase activator